MNENVRDQELEQRSLVNFLLDPMICLIHERILKSRPRSTSEL